MSFFDPNIDLINSNLWWRLLWHPLPLFFTTQYETSQHNSIWNFSAQRNIYIYQLTKLKLISNVDESSDENHMTVKTFLQQRDYHPCKGSNIVFWREGRQFRPCRQGEAEVPSNLKSVRESIWSIHMVRETKGLHHVMVTYEWRSEKGRGRW